MKNSCALFILAAAPLIAAGTGKMNDAERAYLLDQLEQTRKNVLATIQGLSDAQWRCQPAPTVWSVQECAEHIILSEEFLFSGAQVALKSPAVERPANSNLDFDRMLAGKIQDRGLKFTAPEPLVPSKRFATPADAAKEFALRRDKTIAYVKSTNDDLRVHVGDGPGGPMDSYQFLVLLAAHSARHTAQIREVESNAAYPKPAVRSQFLVVYSLAHGTPDQITPP
ncbi:MAG: DinB family protein [Candidatus Sulfopaludibacter sp.]|nr:DinB family protein [Candidatus Sulfopaludibacter sp.]